MKRVVGIVVGLGVVALAALLLIGGAAQTDDRNALYKSYECVIYYDNAAARLRNTGDRAGAEAATRRRDAWEEGLSAVFLTTDVPDDEIWAIEDRAYAEHRRQMAQGDWAAYEKRYARQCS
ncbi:MAG: hypothetical protein AB7F36_10610 [Reyranellaceae bacterium]